MFVKSAVRLTLALALALSACGDEAPATDKDKDPAGKSDAGADRETDDDSETDEETDVGDDSDKETDEGEDPEVDASKPPRDAGAPVMMGPKDSGASADASKPDDAGDDEEDAGDDAPVVMGDGECCDDGDCLCHGPAPTGLTSENGPYSTKNYSTSAGCVYYPEDAEGPLAAVAISDGFGGSGGCGRTQTNGWGDFYASWGIVTMIINTTGGDQPNARGRKLTAAIEAFKAENTKSGSPLNGKLSGRYGTSGFSMGGGGTSYSSAADATLKTSVAIMPWGPTRSAIKVPTLVICGASDGIASCASHGTPLYRSIGEDVPKMIVEVSGGHNGQPTAGGRKSGEYGLAFQKVFLEGDERWRPFLTMAPNEGSTVK